MATPVWFGTSRNVSRIDAASTKTGRPANSPADWDEAGQSVTTSASVTTSSRVNIQGWTRISGLWVYVSAIAGGSATVTVKLQHSPDGGLTWFDTGLATSALSATGGVLVAVDRDLFPDIRCVATLSATTTPTATYKAYIGHALEQGSVPRGA